MGDQTVVQSLRGPVSYICEDQISLTGRKNAKTFDLFQRRVVDHFGDVAFARYQDIIMKVYFDTISARPSIIKTIVKSKNLNANEECHTPRSAARKQKLIKGT